MTNEPQISSPVSPVPTAALIVRHELHHARNHWWWFLLLGVVLVICGTASLVYPLLASLAAVTFLSVMLLVAGVTTLVGSFWIG